MLTWLEKHRPRSVEDLVIHPKKLKEIEDWLLHLDDNPRDKFLLLIGPCGCGKSTSLRLTAQKFQYEVVEWITPLDRDYDPDLRGDDQTYQNAADVFEQFICRAARYPSLFSQSKGKLVFVKDFPNIFIQNVEILHQILRKYMSLNSHPIVFVCNDDNLKRNLFPESLCQECNFRTISFNPVHSKAVVKALTRILKLESKTNSQVATSKVDCDAVFQSSAGDLRSAIIKLYWHVIANPIKRFAKNTEEGESTVSKARNKDENVDLFHLLGRVMYASRLNDASSNQFRFAHDPDELVDAVMTQPLTFVSFLHENYLPRFSNIHSVAVASRKLCEADSILTRAYGCHHDTNELGLSIAIRGIMVTNATPVRSFKPFVKPKKYETGNVLEEARTTFPQFRHSAVDVMLYTLPLLNQSGYSFTNAERKIVDKLVGPFRR